MNFRIRAHEQQSHRTPARISEENYPRLSHDEIEGIEKRFKKQDKRNVGYITRDDLFEILRKIGHFVSDTMRKRINEELNRREAAEKVDLLTLLDLVNEVKDWMEQEEYDLENEYVDAFVALGGKPDKTGTVKKEALVNLIQGEFELTYDVEGSFGIDGEELDFQTFCLFCEGAGSEKMNKKNNLAMVMNEKQPIRMNSNGSFVVRFEDFEKFAAKGQQKNKMFLY